MKKKVLVIMGLSLMLLAGGCTKNGAAGDLTGGKTNSNDTDSTSTDTNTNVTIPEKGEYNVDDYIKLGKYKGVEVTVDKEVAENERVEGTADELKNLVEVGDVVNIDYEGLKDGVAFDGGTATGSDLEIGSNSFIDGFETGLIGKKVGDKVKLDLTFPADYGSEDLAGQAVVFNVTINSIEKGVAVKRDASNSVLDAILKDSKISSYPQTLIDYYSASYKNYISQMLYYSYGMTITQYIEQIKSTQDEFDANVEKMAENYASLEMVQRAIAEKEGLKITDDDYKNEIDQYVSDYGAASEEELLTYMTKDQVKDDMLLKKALNFAVDNAVVTVNEVTPTPAPVATTAPTATPAAK